jgi:hypothetical protein
MTDDINAVDPTPTALVTTAATITFGGLVDALFVVSSCAIFFAFGWIFFNRKLFEDYHVLFFDVVLVMQLVC